MTLPSIVVLLILLYGLFRPVGFLFVLSFVLLPFGSLAVIPPEMVGGITLLPGPLAFIFIIMKTFFARGGAASFFRMAFSFQHLGYLTAFIVVAVAGAFLLPRLFLGQVYIFVVRPPDPLGMQAFQPLSPTSSNITQTAYIVISYFTAVAFSVLARTKGFIEEFRKAVLALAISLAASGLIDYGLGLAGQAAILDSFRTASYVIYTESAINGMRRIIGLMPEASAYGALAITSLSLLVFCRNVFPPDTRNKVVFPLAGLLTILLALCTSSTAYVALAVVIAVYFWDATARLGVGTPADKLQTTRELTALGAITLLGVVLIFVFDETREMAYKMLDDMVFKKGQSSSFAERSSWNDAAVRAFFHTNGVGIGVGSLRTSNFFANLLAATGALGVIFFSAFMLRLAFIKPKLDNVYIHEMVRGAKLSLLPMFAAMGLSGTSTDFGTTGGILFGLAIGAATMIKKSDKVNETPTITKPSRRRPVTEGEEAPV